MGKVKRTTNTRASTPTPTKLIFENNKKSKQMKTKGKKLSIKNRMNKINKISIKEKLEVEEDDEIISINENNKDNNNNNNNDIDNDNMIVDNFKEEVFGKLDVLKMERNIEDIKM